MAQIESAEAAEGRLGAVLRAPRTGGLSQLGSGGPWLATTPEQAKRVLMDAAGFDFPNTVSRSTDMSASVAESRTGHYVNPPLTAAQVERGRVVFGAEWGEAVAGLEDSAGVAGFEAMHLLRRPMARATCAAVLDGLDIGARDDVADQVLAWIDALGPVIASRRSPGRWSRVRRGESRARLALDGTLTDVLATQGVRESPPVVATMLAAGIQVPIAAGAWLLVLLAANPHGRFDADHSVWETLRVAPPTWVTARVTTGPVELAGQQLPAGEVVLVSPLLLGRLAELVPGEPEGLGTFDPDRWARAGVRPGAWLPFGAGAHSCPGRNLGLGLLRDLAAWADQHQLALTGPVAIDQSRGILPSPSRITFSRRRE